MVLIAVSEIESGLQLDEDEFESRFGFPKPMPISKSIPKLNRRTGGTEKPIVLNCMSGFRARKAQKIFDNFGFDSMKIYDVSFKDWNANGGNVEFRN